MSSTSFVWISRVCFFSVVLLLCYSRLAPQQHDSNSSPLNVFQQEDDACVDPMGQDDPCEFVRQKCQGEDFESDFGWNWLEVHACVFLPHKLGILSFAILFGCTLLLFSLLGSTADGYLAPSLTEVSDLLKLSPEVAGATLLSFANAAPDVFSIIAGADEDITISIGAALGSSLFAVSLIITFVTFAVGEFKVNKGPFMRDLVVYFAGVVIFGAFCFNGELHLWQIIIVLAYFAAYIGYLIISELFENLKLKKAGLLSKKSLKNINSDDVDLDTVLIEKQIEEPYSIKSALVKGLEWDEKTSVLDKIIGFIELPFVFVRYLTIPQIEEDSSVRALTLTTPFFASIFLIWQFEIDVLHDKVAGLPMIYPIGALVLALTAWVSLTTTQSRVPKPFILWLILCVVLSVQWLELIADELVLLLSSISRIFGLSPTLIGLLVLSVGNGIGDLVANLVVARAGQPLMAVGAIFSSSLLSMNLGLGISMLERLISEYPKPVTFEDDGNISITFIFLIISCLVTLVMIPVNKFKSTKPFALVQLILYSLFVVLAVLVGINVIKPFWV
ncbi:hypothetical protein P9112_010484 [Eukaryota sp. TZLM1-RC]